jgi:tetratricopeptide (TPR) repeat protein
MISIQQKEIQELVNSLIKCPSFEREADRQHLIEQLPAQIRQKIRTSNVDVKKQAAQVIDVCLLFESGITLLKEIVSYYDKETIHYAEFEEKANNLIAYIEQLETKEQAKAVKLTEAIPDILLNVARNDKKGSRKVTRLYNQMLLAENRGDWTQVATIGTDILSLTLSDSSLKSNAPEQEIRRKTAYSYNWLGNDSQRPEEPHLHRAITFYKKAIELFPNYVIAYNNLAQVHVKLRDYNEALNCYRQALQHDFNSSVTYYNLALLYEQMGRLDEALHQYEQTLKIDKKSAVAYHNRAIVFLKKEKYDKAVQNLDEAIKLEPHNKFFIYNRGLAYEAAGKKKKAQADFRKALELGHYPAGEKLQ